MKLLLKIEHLLFVLLIIFIPSQLAKHFWPSASFISGIRIDYLSPALYFNDLVIFFLLTIALIRNRIKVSKFLKDKYKQLSKKCIYKRNNLIYFLLFVTINILVSPRKLITTYYWLRILQLMILYFYLHLNSKSLKSLFLKYLPIPVVYSSFIAISQTLKQSSIGGIFYWLGERRFSLSTPGIAKTSFLGRLILRPYATFPHPNALAGFILLSIIINCYSMQKKNLSIFNILLCFFSLITLIISFSQSAWILGLFCIWIILIKDNKNVYFKRVLNFLIVSLISIILFCSEKQSFTERFSIFTSSINIVRKFPIFGVGLGNYIPAMFKNNGILSSYMSPFLYYQPVHNIYLLLFTELGLFGIFIIINILMYFKRNLKIISPKLKLSLIVVMIMGLVDHYWLTLYQNKLFLTLLIGLL